MIKTSSFLINYPGMLGRDGPPISVYNKTHMIKTSSFLINYPGMLGRDGPPVSVYNKTHMIKTSSFLINDGPWHDVINRYTFKDNRCLNLSLILFKKKVLNLATHCSVDNGKTTVFVFQFEWFQCKWFCTSRWQILCL